MIPRDLMQAVMREAGADLSSPASEVAKVLRSSPGELGAAVAGEALSAATAAMPAAAAALVGALGIVAGVASVALAIVDAVGWAEGKGPNQSERAERVAWCQSSFVPPRGSGPGLQIVPADLFTVNSFDGFGQRRMPTVGRSLLHVTEVESTTFVKTNAGANPALRLDLGGATGFPQATCGLYRSMRESIAALYRKGDGGASIFILYLDLLRIHRQRKVWTPALMRILIAARESMPMHVDVRDDGEYTCLDNDPRPYQAVIDLIDGWDQTVNNPYASTTAEAAFPLNLKRGVGLLARRDAPRAALGIGSVIAGRLVK